LLLRVSQHGLIRKIDRMHEYYVIRFGGRILLVVPQLPQFLLIPSLA